MKDRILLIAGLLVVMAVATWLVRSEGERFRKSLRETADTSLREAARDAGEQAVEAAGEEAEGVIDKTADRAGELIDKAIDAPGKILGDIRDTVTNLPPRRDVPGRHVPAPRPPPTPDEPAPSENPRDEPGRDVGQQEERTASEPAAKIRPGSTESRPERVEVRPEEVISEIFKLGREVTRTADDLAQEVLALSEDDERRIGADVHRLIRSKYRLVDSLPVQRRLERIAKPLVERTSRKGVEYRFFVIDDDELNAFAHVGGYIYVNKGLLKLAKDDYDLEFVLGHEIAHEELKHCVRSMTYAARAGKIAGESGANLTLLAYQAIALGYSEDYEFEADAWSFRQMIALGREHEEALAFLHIMHDHFRERESKDEEGSDVEKTPVKVVSREIKNHFRSHPSTADRIARLKLLDR